MTPVCTLPLVVTSVLGEAYSGDSITLVLLLLLLLPYFPCVACVPTTLVAVAALEACVETAEGFVTADVEVEVEVAVEGLAGHEVPQPLFDRLFWLGRGLLLAANNASRL